MFKMILAFLFSQVLAIPVLWAAAEVESRTFQEDPVGQIEFVESPIHEAVQANANGDVYSRLDMLTQEVSELRGRLEEQAHQLQQLSKRQREFYLDLDKRLGGTGPSHLKEEIADNTQAFMPNDSQRAQELSSEIAAAPVIVGHKEDDTAYRAAYELVRQKKYTEATAAFKKIAENSQSKYVPNAYFWLGELAMLAGNSAEAEADYNAVVNQYPTHAKTPDALVKLGILALDKNHNDVAKQLFTRVINEFPDAPAAQVAAKQKKRLEKAGE